MIFVCFCIVASPIESCLLLHSVQYYHRPSWISDINHLLHNWLGQLRALQKDVKDKAKDSEAWMKTMTDWKRGVISWQNKKNRQISALYRKRYICQGGYKKTESDVSGKSPVWTVYFSPAFVSTPNVVVSMLAKVSAIHADTKIRDLTTHSMTFEITRNEKSYIKACYLACGWFDDYSSLPNE